jgi:hypothetical protein
MNIHYQSATQEVQFRVIPHHNRKKKNTQEEEEKKRPQWFSDTMQKVC